MEPDPSLQKIIDATNTRNRVAKEKLKLRIDEALTEAKRLAALFTEKDPSLQKVVLFGSLAEETVRSEEFDIDLAVVSDDIIRLMNIAEDSRFPVDVADLERLPEPIRRRVEERGKILYEKQ